MIPLRIIETSVTLVSNSGKYKNETNSEKRKLSDSANGKASNNESKRNVISNNSSKNNNIKTMERGKEKCESSLKESVLETSFDDVPVEACLEYLTRPHTSWRSVAKLHAQRKERIQSHSLSVYSRSKTASRRHSFASSSFSANVDGNSNKYNRRSLSRNSINGNNGGVLWNSFASFQSMNSTNGSENVSMNDSVSCVSSVCSAPVGANMYNNINNKNSKSKLTKGRLWRGGRMAPTLPSSSSSAYATVNTSNNALSSLEGNSLTVTSLAPQKANLLHSNNNDVSYHTANNSDNNIRNMKIKQQKPSAKGQIQKAGVLRSSNYLPPLSPLPRTSRVQSNNNNKPCNNICNDQRSASSFTVNATSSSRLQSKYNTK